MWRQVCNLPFDSGKLQTCRHMRAPEEVRAMKLKQRKPARRAAFTLIELLIVIAIIAILVSLLSSAVIFALRKGNEVTARSDISQLTTAVGTFKQKLGILPPSRLRLCVKPSQYP